MRRHSLPLRDEQQTSADRIALAKRARALLAGEEKWSNNVQLDQRWTEVEKEDAVSSRQ